MPQACSPRRKIPLDVLQSRRKSSSFSDYAEDHLLTSVATLRGEPDRPPYRRVQIFCNTCFKKFAWFLRKILSPPSHADSLSISPMLIQLFNSDVLIPAITAMVLEADVACAGKLLVGDVKFMGASVRTLVRLGELIQVRFGDLFAIEDDGDRWALAGDFNMVPFSGRFHCVFDRFHEVV